MNPEAICDACGRVEALGSYCSYCVNRGERVPLPSSADIHAIRYALVRLHGWSSLNLCPELRRHPQREIDDSIKSGVTSPSDWAWVL